MKPYEVIEHTADVGLKVNGSTLKELFTNAAKGMFEIIKGAEVKKDDCRRICKKVGLKKKVESPEELLVDWLSELLYIFNKDQVLFSDFSILQLNNSGIISESSGKKTRTTLVGLPLDP